MLNIYPSSIPSTPHLPTMLRRRRGGQPFNRNALNHGLYAVKNRTPLSDLSSTLPAYPRLLDCSSPSVSQQLILDLMEEIGRAYQKLRSVEDNRSINAWFNTTVRMVALVGRMKEDYIKRFLIGSDLQVVSEHAIALIHNSFIEKGIAGEDYSFRDNRYKSDFNSLALEEALCPSVSRSPFPFLTPQQWAVLAPLVPRAERTGKRGRPPADRRKLLDAIFWKLAYHARWQDLPYFYPPMLTCRRYYRRLLLGGRLNALFSALYQDLLTRGKVSLSALVEKGGVEILENKVILRHGLDKKWQIRAALLILQQGYQALRKERGGKAQEHPNRYESSRRIARDKEIQARAAGEEREFSFTPIDLAHFGSYLETADELAIVLGKKRLKVPRHIDTGQYSFTPIDLGNLGSDEDEDEDEVEDETPKPGRKNLSLHHSKLEADKCPFAPIDFTNLDICPVNEGEPGISPFFTPLSLLPPLITRDSLSPLISYSPAVPNTQSQSGELTP